MSLKLVVVSANVGPKSKIKLLADALATLIREKIAVEIVNVEIGPLIPELGGALFRKDLPLKAEAALRQIESADLLIAATPVYKGSYTGHFKHVFDLIEPDALIGVPVALIATGGGERHALVIEHQLRPLFGFFQALALPTALYASDADFVEHRIHHAGLLRRMETLAAEAAWALRKEEAPADQRDLVLAVA